MDTKEGSESDKHLTETVAKEVDAVGPLISFAESEQESGSKGPSIRDPEHAADKATLVLNSSFEDLFQLDLKVISNSGASTAASSKPHDEPSLFSDDQIEVFNDTSLKSKQHDSGNTSTTLPVIDLPNEPTLESTLPTQSPPIQVMERSEFHSPTRMPSFTFDSKSPAPMEWSIASNDSLFSINFEKNSLSRDRDSMVRGDLNKSGKLSQSGELFSPREPIKTSESMRFRPTLPSIDVGENEQNSVDMGKDSHTTTAEVPKTEVPAEPAKNQCEEKGPFPEVSWHSSSVVCHTDVNLATNHPLSPPKKKSPWRSCRCCNCSWVLTWPSCCCKRPTCNLSCNPCSCSWSFCHGWNCKRKRPSGYCSSRISADGGAVVSREEELEQRYAELTASRKSACCNWFSCFSCCSKSHI